MTTTPDTTEQGTAEQAQQAQSIEEVETQEVHDASEVLDALEASKEEIAPEGEETPTQEPAAEVEKEASKEPSIGEIRHKKKLAAQERDRQTIAARDQRIQELEAEAKALEENIVDTDEAEDYDEAIQQNAVSKALASVKKQEVENARRQKDTAEREIQAQSYRNFADRGNEIEGVKDFEAVVFNDEVAFTQDTAAALLELDNGANLAYSLATQPAEIARLNLLSPQARLMELGRLSASLTVPKSKFKSSAPAPIAPTEGAGAKHQKAVEDMSYQEQRAHWGMNENTHGFK